MNDEYGDEGDDDGDGGDEERREKEKKVKEKPVMPVFNKEEFLSKWDEEYPPISIPEEVQDEIDADWILTEEEEE